MSDCSVLVCSCDKYQDAWIPFFTLFNRYWNDCPYPVYLNTETKNYKDKNINITTINSNPKWSWSKRLKSCLKRIDSRFVILMLDDFFLLSDVRQNIVSDCIQWMKNDNIASICFERYGVIKNDQVPINNFFVQREPGARYTFSLQIGIWDKNTLIKCLRNFESPWEFEEIGNLRSLGINKKFFVQMRNSTSVFNYNINIETGYGLYRGKWLRSNAKLFSKEKIYCDFSNLGFFENKSQFVTQKRPFKEKIIYYAKNPSALFKTAIVLFKSISKRIYWYFEKKYYYSFYKFRKK
ncbi:MAG: hypothetical protein J5659_07030 [Clostridia bacterium]|nr:hypothetical protein [Clostridia bacterium]